MKEFINIFILTMFVSVCSLNVKALSCPNEVSKDLTQVAYYVKTNYEVIDNSINKELIIDDNKTTYKIPNYEFVISIYNITDDIYVTINDDIYHDNITINKENTVDGIYSFTNSDFGTIYNYKFTIYSARSECFGEQIKELKLVKPMYNAYSEYTYCKNSSNYYCQKFTNNDLKLKSNEDFLSKIKINSESLKPIEEEKKEEKTTIIDLLRKNWKAYIALFSFVVIVTIIIISIIRRKNRKWEV